MKNETIISNHKNNETIITTSIRLMYIMLEEELYELDWKCLKKNYELDWKFRKKTPGCRDERRESERREGK